MGKGALKAYEKGEWDGDVVGTWGALVSLANSLKLLINNTNN